LIHFAVVRQLTIGFGTKQDSDGKTNYSRLGGFIRPAFCFPQQDVLADDGATHHR